MNRTITKFVIFSLLITFFSVSSLTPVAQAVVIDTQHVLSNQNGSALFDVEGFLAREDVQAQLVTLGVDSDDARLRIAALTDQELRQLQQHINDLPAGSNALAVLGAVFLVLLVLELVGVTNVFSKL
jgi:hypothetical protein